jgi:hypothetical protein
LTGNIVNPIVLCFILISMISGKISLKNKIYLFLGFVLIILSVIQNTFANKTAIVFNFLFVIALYKKNFRFILMVLFYTYASMLVLFYCLSKTNLIENTIMYRVTDVEMFERYALGMIHPNIFYLYYFICICLFICLNRKLNLFGRFLILVLSYYVYTLTDTRAGFIVTILLLAVDFLFEKLDLQKNKILKVILINLFSILTFGAFFVTKFLNRGQQVFDVFDSLMSHRLLMMQNFYETYGIKLFGNFVTYKTIENGVVNNPDLILDNTYMYLLVDMGLIFTIFVCIIYYKLIKNLIDLNLKKEVAILVIYMIYGFSDRITLLQYNFSILFFYYLLNVHNVRKGTKNFIRFKIKF